MFLEELSLPIHVRAVEESVTINLLIIEGSGLLHLMKGICLIPQVILVALRMILFGSSRTLRFLLLSSTLIKGILKFAKTVI